MKKIFLSLFLATMFIFSLTGCSTETKKYKAVAQKDFRQMEKNFASLTTKYTALQQESTRDNKINSYDTRKLEEFISLNNNLINKLDINIHKLNKLPKTDNVRQLDKDLQKFYNNLRDVIKELNSLLSYNLNLYRAAIKFDNSFKEIDPLIDKAQDPDELADAFSRIKEILAAFTAEIKAANPPSFIKEKHNRLLLASEQYINLIDLFIQAVEAGDTDKVQSLEYQIDAVSNKFISSINELSKPSGAEENWLRELQELSKLEKKIIDEF